MPYVLSPFQRQWVLREIADERGLAWQVVKHTIRTDAQIVAMLRDLPYCQYHLHVLDALRPIHDVHHTAGRVPSLDLPELCISLCYECHYRVENGLGKPYNEELTRLLTTVLSRLPALPSNPSPGSVPPRFRPPAPTPPPA